MLKYGFFAQPQPIQAFLEIEISRLTKQQDSRTPRDTRNQTIAYRFQQRTFSCTVTADEYIVAPLNKVEVCMGKQLSICNADGQVFDEDLVWP